AQYRAAIGVARVRGRPGALELQLVARAVRADRLAERDRAAIAELTGPVPELVAAVVRRERLHTIEQRVAAEHLGEARRLDVLFRQAKRTRDLVGVRNDARHRNRGRHDPRPGRALHLARLRSLAKVAGKRANKTVVESDSCQYFLM